MKWLAACVTWAAIAVIVPAQAQSGGEDPLAALVKELGITDAQRTEMRAVVDQFLAKQANVPTPGEVVVDNRAMLREIITSAKFDEQKARAFVQKVTAVMEKATVNRLQLRHDLYGKLTPAQQKQYLDMVQAAVAKGLE